MKQKLPRLKNKIYFFSHNKTHNLGDELINDLLEDNLNSFGKTHRKKKGRFASASLVLQAIASALRSCVFGNDRVYFFLPPGHTFSKGFFLTLKQAAQLATAGVLCLLRVRVVKMSFSVGPFNKLDAFLEKNLGKLCHFYGPRDKRSLDLSHHIGIKSAKICEDLAWLLNFTPKSTPPDCLILSFRKSTYSGDQDYGNTRAFQQNLLEAVKALTQDTTLKIILSCQVEEDLEYMIEIGNFLNQNEIECLVLPSKLSVNSALELYATAAYVVSNRLHVLLMAMSQDALAIPLINIRKHRKISGLFEDAHLGMTMIDTTRFSKEDLIKTISEIRHAKHEKQYEKLFQKKAQLLKSSLAEIFA